MVKATSPLTPRQVLGNRRRALSIEEALALAQELDTAIAVWANLPLQEPRTCKVSHHVAVLEEQLASLQQEEARNV
jgi:hypothetical protein